MFQAPPPPPSPQIAKDVNVFTYEQLMNLLSIVFPSCTYVSSVRRSSCYATLVLLDSTCASPGPPKNGKMFVGH